nr:MAG TPA: hypothetical protein [Caudoviricetes sp.]
MYLIILIRPDSLINRKNRNCYPDHSDMRFLLFFSPHLTLTLLSHLPIDTNER